MLNIYFLVTFVIILLPFTVVSRAAVAYLQDLKGFRKYPAQNWLSAFTKLAYCWEMGRKYPVFHSRRLYLKHSTKGDKVIRLGPNWISFGRARAARDIYGYTSPCIKAAIYDQMTQAGGANLNSISNKSLHKTRRSMMSHYFAPKNQQFWEESWVLDSNANLMKAVDTMCTARPKFAEDPSLDDLKFDLVHWSHTYVLKTIIKNWS